MIPKATLSLLRFQMSPFSYHSVFERSWAVSNTPFSSREPGYKNGVVSNASCSIVFISFVQIFPFRCCLAPSQSICRSVFE